MVHILKFSDVEHRVIRQVKVDKNNLYIVSDSDIRVISKSDWEQIALFKGGIGRFRRFCIDEQYLYLLTGMGMRLIILRIRKDNWEREVFRIERPAQLAGRYASSHMLYTEADDKFIYIGFMLEFPRKEWVITVINKDTMSEAKELKNTGGPFDSNEEFFVTAYGRSIKVYEKRSLSLVYEEKLFDEIREALTDVIVDDKYFYAGSYSRPWLVWEFNTWKRIEFPDNIKFIAAIDDEYIYSAPWRDYNKLHVWNKRTYECVKTFEYEKNIPYTLVIDDKYIYLATLQNFLEKKDTRLYIYVKKAWEKIKTIESSTQAITSICVNKRFIFASSSDKIRVWNRKNGKEIVTLQDHYSDIATLCADEETLISGSKDSNYIVWDLSNFTKIKELSEAHYYPGFKPDEKKRSSAFVKSMIDDKYIYCVKNKEYIIEGRYAVPSVRVYDNENFENIATLIDRRNERSIRSFYDIWVDDKYIYAGGFGGVLSIWERGSWNFIDRLDGPLVGGNKDSIDKIRTDNDLVYISYNQHFRIVQKESWNLIKETKSNDLNFYRNSHILGVDDNYIYFGGTIKQGEETQSWERKSPALLTLNKNNWNDRKLITYFESAVQYSDVIQDYESIILPITNAVIGVWSKEDSSLQLLLMNGFGQEYHWYDEHKTIIRGMNAVSNNIIVEIDEYSKDSKPLLKKIVNGEILPVEFTDRAFYYNTRLVEECGQILKYGKVKKESKIEEKLEEKTKKALLKEEEAQILKNIEGELGEKIPQVDNINLTLFGHVIEQEHVTHLKITGKKIKEIPKNIGDLKFLKTLDLSVNEITNIPESIGRIKNLKSLNLKLNTITSIPESIGNLKDLIKLNLKNNSIESLPDTIGNLNSLERLILDENPITLPETIGKLSNQIKLSLGGRKMKYIPSSIQKLKALKILRFSPYYTEIFQDSLIKLQSLDKESWLRVGNAFFRKKDYDKTIIAYERARALGDINDCQLSFLASSYLAIDKITEAINIYERVLEMAPNEYRYWNSIGECYLKIKHYDSAKEAFEKALRINVKYDQAFENLKKLKQTTESQKLSDSDEENLKLELELKGAWEKIIQKDYNEEQAKDAYFWVAIAELYMKNLPGGLQDGYHHGQAWKAYEIALKLEPDSQRVLMSKAKFHEGRWSHYSALELYKKVLELDPKNIRAFREILLIYPKVGESNMNPKTKKFLKDMILDRILKKDSIILSHLKKHGYRGILTDEEYSNIFD